MVRATKFWGFVDQIRQDLAYTARAFARTPGFAALIVVTLALGIGASTLMFSVVRAVLLRPLPYSEPQRLVMLWESDPSRSNGVEFVSPAAFRDWKGQNHAFSSLAAFIHSTFTLTGADQPERIGGELVSSDFLAVLRIQPSLGRGFVPDDEQHVPYTSVIISQNLWQRRVNADPHVVGRTLRVNGRALTIIGVMPPGFQFPAGLIRTAPDIWVPLARPPQEWSIRDFHYLRVIGRLRDGVTLQAAAVAMNALQRNITQTSQKDGGSRVTLVSLQREMTGDVRTPLLVLLGAVFCLLLIGCVNVANLLLARGSARQREFAIRIALGAGRRRILRQLCAEGVLLAFVGGGLGVLLAVWATGTIVALAPITIPRVGETRLDIAVLVFTLIVSSTVGVVAGLAPAIGIIGSDTAERLKAGGRGAIGEPSANRLRALLVVGEIALALVLLTGAGLMIQSLYRLGHVNPGFRTSQILTFFVTIPDANYRQSSRQTAFFRNLKDRIQTLPGVESVGATTALPLSGTNDSYSFDIEGRSRAQSKPIADYRTITPDYFQTLGIPLLQGRFFNDRDTADSPPVVIVNEALVRTYFSGESPVGQHIHVGHDRRPGMSEIVGVVGDVRHASLAAEPTPEMYESFEQMPSSFMTIAVRAATDPRSLVSGIRDELAAVDRNVPLSKVMSVDELLTETLSPSRFRGILLGTFALFALVLAAVGIYGVVAYAVNRRTSEIGIRIALGAQRGQVVLAIVGPAFKLASAGAAIGSIAGLVLTRLFANLLYGVKATDPLTFGATAVCLILVALAASYLPARRAAAIDPIQTLRKE